MSRVNTSLVGVLGKEHEQKWVALSQDRRELLGAAENLLTLREKMGKKRNDCLYMRVLRSDIEYSFSCPWRG